MSEPLIEKKEIKKLLELNEELENYFRNTIIPQLFIDADLILRKFSPPANMHFKLTETDISKPIHEIPNLANLPGLVESILDVIANSQDLEKEIQTSDQRWFQMNILPYIIKKQNITNGVVITFIDITGRINDKRDIERINSEYETFIYAVSHDLRGPLTNMVLLIELIKYSFEENDREDFKNLLKNMERSARSMKTIISELTDITKTGMDLSTHSDTIDLEDILNDVKFTLKNQIYQSHAKITTNIQVPMLVFSKKKLRSILYNLFSNAIKFAAPDRTPEIFVKTEISGEYTLLSIKDNGVGIESEKQSEIFSKFTRLSPQIEGTGVGLFIVNQMVTNWGGKIEVDSKVGVGTTFNIYLKSLRNES